MNESRARRGHDARLAGQDHEPVRALRLFGQSVWLDSLFLQLTCEDAADLPVPGQRYSFGVVKATQAHGDFQVLAERGRRLLRVHLGADVQTGLVTLKSAMEQALA